MVDKVKQEKAYLLPQRNIGFLLFQMAKNKMWMPEVFKGFEAQYPNLVSKELTTRHAYGGLWAYYYSNQGSLEGIDFWEKTLEQNSNKLHLQEICELLEAFNVNHQLHRNHMRQKLNTFYKPFLMAQWDPKAKQNQRILVSLAEQFVNLSWYDEDIWNLLIDSVLSKKKIQNIYFLDSLLHSFDEVNTDPESPFYNKLGPKISEMRKFIKTDFRWRYNFTERRFRTYEELVARRDDCAYGDWSFRKVKIDKAAEARKEVEARNLRRLQLSKYNPDLYTEIIEEMMKDGRTMLEMMIELDTDEQSIIDAQERIQQRVLEEQTKEAQEAAAAAAAEAN